MKTSVRLLALLILFSLNSCGQEAQKEVRKEVIEDAEKEFQLPDEFKKDKVVIFNSSDKKVSYFLGASLDDLDKFSIKPRQSKVSFSFDEKPIFKIYTSKKIFSQYALNLGEEYKIYYNNESKKWDLTRMVVADP